MTVSIFYALQNSSSCTSWLWSTVEVKQHRLWESLRRPDFQGKTAVIFDIITRNNCPWWNRSLGCRNKALLLFRKVGYDLVLEVKTTYWKIFNDWFYKIVIFSIFCDHLIFENCVEISSLRFQLDDKAFLCIRFSNFTFLLHVSLEKAYISTEISLIRRLDIATWNCWARDCTRLKKTC